MNEPRFVGDVSAKLSKDFPTMDWSGADDGAMQALSSSTMDLS
jgi:hypothetical protein